MLTVIACTIHTHAVWRFSSKNCAVDIKILCLVFYLGSEF